jgi:hypothetical protein
VHPLEKEAERAVDPWQVLQEVHPGGDLDEGGAVRNVSVLSFSTDIDGHHSTRD